MTDTRVLETDSDAVAHQKRMMNLFRLFGFLCGDCGRRVGVNHNGGLRKHRRTDESVCRGSGKIVGAYSVMQARLKRLQEN